MLIVASAMVALVGIGSLVHRRRDQESSAAIRPVGAFLAAAVLTFAVVATSGITANAAIVPTVQLGTAANYAVLAASTVTNTGNTVLNGSLGLSPGTDVTGFPPGIVVAPATIDIANAAALQAQSDLTVAYVDAASRPLDATTPADLTDLVLVGGVYAGPAKGALELTGSLVLDGENNADSVFIFQTDSTLTTATGSTVSLINGAQACNVFWQVGSSATLGENSVFVGTILALTSVSLGSNVDVDGRALADNGAVTLIDDDFTAPVCAQAPPDTTTTTAGDTTTTTAADTTTTTVADTTTTTVADTTTTTAGDTTTTTAGDTTTTTAGDTTTTTAGDAASTPATVLFAGPTTIADMTTTTTGSDSTTTTTLYGGTGNGELAYTGSETEDILLLAILAMIIGAVALGAAQAASRR